MRTFHDPGQVIHVSADEGFAISLESNPSTGFTWQVSTDEQYLELLEQSFEPYGPGVGASGHELFYFRARSTGQTTITCEYRRPWEQTAQDTASFEVQIK